jgi:hypothetical protein
MFAGDSDSKRLRRGRCWKCGKRGHYAKDCKEANKSAVVSETADSGEDLAFTVSVKEEFCLAAESCYIDSGASRHMTGNVNLLNNFVDFEESIEITTADGRSIMGVGSGDMKVGDDRVITLKDVVYVPDLSMNLLSVSAATANGAKISFDREHCYAVLDGKEFRLGSRQGKMFVLAIRQPASVQPVDRVLLHKRLGHLSYAVLESMVKGGAVRGVSLCGFRPDVCPQCIEAKMAQRPFRSLPVSRQTRHVNDLVHSDVVGPMSVQCFGGKRYVIFFIDDYSRYMKCYFLAK